MAAVKEKVWISAGGRKHLLIVPQGRTACGLSVKGIPECIRTDRMCPLCIKGMRPVK